MEQCSATKRNGEPCTLPVNGPHGLCWAHDPKNAERRRRAASRAGRAKARGDRRWIMAELLRIAQKVETDESFDPTRANSIIRALTGAAEISRALEQDDIATEFENLKSVLREHGVYNG
jgi:hypothetical protein